MGIRSGKRLQPHYLMLVRASGRGARGAGDTDNVDRPAIPLDTNADLAELVAEQAATAAD
jgi:hypothetical protein